MKLFLDDVRKPYDVFKNTLNPIFENDNDWIIVKTYEEFVDHINNNGLPNTLSLDNDLSFDHYLPEVPEGGYKEKTGYDCTVWLLDYCVKNNLTLPKWYVHSANQIAKEKMINLLENF